MPHRYKRYNCLICGRPITHKGNCYSCNIKKKRHKNKRQDSEHIKHHKDHNGYIRNRPSHSTLIHRQVAYEQIYKKNRELYPLPFGKYVVHHIDGNKLNNRASNLQILTREKHEEVHGIVKKEEVETNKKKSILEWLDDALGWIYIAFRYCLVGWGAFGVLSIMLNIFIRKNPSFLYYIFYFLTGLLVLTMILMALTYALIRVIEFLIDGF